MTTEIIQITMAHQQYWDFQIQWVDEQFLKSQVNMAVLEILRTTPEAELWIVEYDDSLPQDDDGWMREWIATPRDFDWRILTRSQEDRRWRNLIAD